MGADCAFGELVNLKVSDVDLSRKMLHVVQGKGRKDRYVPLGDLLCRGIAAHIEAESPRKTLFTGKDHTVPMSTRGTTWAVNEAVKRAGIKKNVSCHTLRHSYATHLLEMGMDIMTIKELLGHERIETTLVYLHVSQSGRMRPFSPLKTSFIRKSKCVPLLKWLMCFVRSGIVLPHRPGSIHGNCAQRSIHWPAAAHLRWADTWINVQRVEL